MTFCQNSNQLFRGKRIEKPHQGRPLGDPGSQPWLWWADHDDHICIDEGVVGHRRTCIYVLGVGEPRSFSETTFDHDAVPIFDET